MPVFTFEPIASSGGSMEMLKLSEIYKRVESDLGLNIPYVPKLTIEVRNCWHFCTDGNAVDVMFYDEQDFIKGMNRIFVTVQKYGILILAFVLMDTHVHFILYGDFDECNHFMHEYVRRTSMYIAHTQGVNNKLDNLPIHYQNIDSDDYLKQAICYVIKNPPVGGLPYTAWNYPWSSGGLYFNNPGHWTSPAWRDMVTKAKLSRNNSRQVREILNTRLELKDDVSVIGDMVFPGEYVPYKFVERIFKTCRGYNHLLCKSRESDIESRNGSISLLSLPIYELRQHKRETCMELFGKPDSNTLNTQQRLHLARTLRSRYNSSLKQIIKVCGLIYDEVVNMF